MFTTKFEIGDFSESYYVAFFLTSSKKQLSLALENIPKNNHPLYTRYEFTYLRCLENLLKNFLCTFNLHPVLLVSFCLQRQLPLLQPGNSLLMKDTWVAYSKRCYTSKTDHFSEMANW